MDNITSDLENKENLIKYADDIMNYSLDSLNLNNTPKYSGPALVSADSAEQQSMLELQQEETEREIDEESKRGKKSIIDTTNQDNSKIIIDDSQKIINLKQQENAHISFQTAIGHNSVINDLEEEEEEEQQQKDEVKEQEPVLIQEPSFVQEKDFSLQQDNLNEQVPDLIQEASFDQEKEFKQQLQQQDEHEHEVKQQEPELIQEALFIQEKEFEQFKQEEKVKPKVMEFTKNYSDDLLMGQSDSTQGRADMPASGVDLADFELPPYSGSSSGSEPRQSNSPIKRKSSTSSSAPAQASSNQPQTSVGLRGLKNLLMTSYSGLSHVLQWKKPIETVVAYSALGIIMTSGSIRVYKSIMQTLNKSPETPFDHVWDKIQNMNVSIFTERIVEFIDVSMVGNLNATLVYLKQVLLFEDKIATLKFGCYFYLLTYIGSWFNGMTLITLTYLAMFTLPIAYEKNKTQIDQYYDLMQSHLCDTTNKVTSMVFGSKKAESASSTKKQN